MKTNIIKILFIVVALCIFSDVVYQIYLKISYPYETTTVYEYSMENTIPTDGFVFKEETVITGNNAGGVVNYLYTNGSHVAIQSEVARIYQNQEDITKTTQIQQLDQQISRLNDAQSIGVSQGTSLSVVEKDLSHAYYSLIENLQQENLIDLAEETNDITTLLNKKQIITGKVQNFNDTIQQLTNEKQQLQSSITSQPQSINTPVAGYFVDQTDGYEGILTLDYASSITPTELQDLLNQPQPAVQSDNIAKIITDPTLQYLGIAPTKYLLNLNVGKKCTLRFSDLALDVPAKVTAISVDPSQENGMVTFSIDYMSDRIAIARRDHVDAVISNNTGLRVPKTAIRVNDQGEQGVYVTNSISMNFRKIDVIYEDEEYVLSKQHTDDSSYLQLYDSIIVQGKDLYDNKPIRS